MIELDKVSKCYRISGVEKWILRSESVSLLRRNYGLLGSNGAGKSTFIRLIAGIEDLDDGQIRRNVRFSWPLGFASNLAETMTGVENTRFVARLFGMDYREMLDFVYDFSELGQHMLVNVGTYSSGMRSRLAFALSMAVDFECYLVDEITAVGDASFSKKCQQAFAERRKRSNIIMTSHSAETIKRFCDAVIILNDGKLFTFDSIEDGINAYHSLVN